MGRLESPSHFHYYYSLAPDSDGLQVLLLQLLSIEQAAHFPFFDFWIKRINAQAAYPKIAPPITRFTIIPVYLPSLRQAD
jgi:hypothetical protein